MNAATAQIREEPPSITRRQVDIDFTAVPSAPWLPGAVPLELMFNAASLSFPPTERFFISAVRDYERQIEDPLLKQQVRGFIFQEAMHNKVHIACNDMLRRLYPNCRRAEQVSLTTFRILNWLPRWFRLSLSSALEHFTSMVAETLLRHADAFRSIMPKAVADMWLWHAVEETEHKSVCFDVQRAVLGKGPIAYINRVAGMVVATLVFLFALILLTAIVLGIGRPRVAANPQPVPQPEPAPAPIPQRVAEPVDTPVPEPAAGATTAAKDPFSGGMLSILWHGVPWRLYFSYYRPGFHPWQHDNSDLVRWWKQTYPGFGLDRGVVTAR